MTSSVDGPLGVAGASLYFTPQSWFALGVGIGVGGPASGPGNRALMGRLSLFRASGLAAGIGGGLSIDTRKYRKMASSGREVTWGRENDRRGDFHLFVEKELGSAYLRLDLGVGRLLGEITSCYTTNQQGGFVDCQDTGVVDVEPPSRWIPYGAVAIGRRTTAPSGLDPVARSDAEWRIAVGGSNVMSTEVFSDGHYHEDTSVSISAEAERLWNWSWMTWGVGGRYELAMGREQFSADHEIVSEQFAALPFLVGGVLGLARPGEQLDLIFGAGPAVTRVEFGYYGVGVELEANLDYTHPLTERTDLLFGLVTRVYGFSLKNGEDYLEGAAGFHAQLALRAGVRLR